MVRKYNVIVEEDVRPLPEPHELSAAVILARYWRKDVYFVGRNLQMSADIRVDGIFWEIKSPIGGGKRTIQNNLREATQQSRNIVIDLRRCKTPTERALSRVKYAAKSLRSIRRLVAVLDNKTVVDIK